MGNSEVVKWWVGAAAKGSGAKGVCVGKEPGAGSMDGLGVVFENHGVCGWGKR